MADSYQLILENLFVLCRTVGGPRHNLTWLDSRFLDVPYAPGKYGFTASSTSG
jgi:hypothetical protein